MEFVLRGVLWFTTYVQPLIFAARVSRSDHASREDVVNATLALVLIWFMEFLDSVALGRLMAATWLYVLFRIGLSWYWMHPRLRGALRMYLKYMRPYLEAYWGSIEYGLDNGFQELRKILGNSRLNNVMASAAVPSEDAVADTSKKAL